MLGACERGPSKPPSHDALVNAYLEGEYEQVRQWCPVMIDDPGADPAIADWCMYSLPAALRLSHDTAGAQDFVRSVCLDVPSDQVKGSDEFRQFYVREVSRWVALPLRAQRLHELLPAAVRASLTEFSAACRVDPSVVARGLDTQIKTR